MWWLREACFFLPLWPLEARNAPSGLRVLLADDMPPNNKLLREKELEKRARLKDIALVYATILLKHSNYVNTQQERQFFESLYDFAKRVLFTINSRKNWHAIENELDRVFRSPHFNLSQRKNDQALKGGGAATMSFKEAYEKSAGADGFTRSPFAATQGASHRSSDMAPLQWRPEFWESVDPKPSQNF